MLKREAQARMLSNVEQPNTPTATEPTIAEQTATEPTIAEQTATEWAIAEQASVAGMDASMNSSGKRRA